ncbi:hypothetical protein PFISCL1PPCAC_21196, partial [Pristionchus fissidentatus]
TVSTTRLRPAGTSGSASSTSTRRTTRETPSTSNASRTTSATTTSWARSTATTTSTDNCGSDDSVREGAAIDGLNPTLETSREEIKQARRSDK